MGGDRDQGERKQLHVESGKGWWDSSPSHACLSVCPSLSSNRSNRPRYLQTDCKMKSLLLLLLSSLCPEPGDPQGPAAAPPRPAGQVPQALARLRPAAPRQEGAPAVARPPQPRRGAPALLGKVGALGREGVRAEARPRGGEAAARDRGAGGLARGGETEQSAALQGARTPSLRAHNSPPILLLSSTHRPVSLSPHLTP